MRIKPSTLSIVIGSSACNARCPFCISKMTVDNGVTIQDSMNYKNFYQAANLAIDSGVTTVMLTGKGEPTLFPRRIEEVLQNLGKSFPIVELQTNGITIADGDIDKATLEEWFDLGLRIIAISNVGLDAEFSRKIYTPRREKYIDLQSLVFRLHSIGFSVRLTTMAMKGGVDSSSKMKDLISWAYDNCVEQLTVRSIVAPTEEVPGRQQVINWTLAHALTNEELEGVFEVVKDRGTRLLVLPHGAEVYDYLGQNVCLANCLTEHEDPEDIRQLIYFPDGRVRHSWQYRGAVLL